LGDLGFGPVNPVQRLVAFELWAANQLGLVAATEDMPDQFVAVVQANGAGTLQPSHARDQIGIGRLDDQVLMVAIRQ
jgi:hypothetical protein